LLWTPPHRRDIEREGRTVVRRGTRLKSLSASSARLMTIDALATMLALLEQARAASAREADNCGAQRRKKPAGASHALPNHVFGKR
jgi:hypothetical protein